MAEEREISIRLTGRNLTHAEFSKARQELMGLGAAADHASARGGLFAGVMKGAAGTMAGFLGASAVMGAVRAGFDFAVGGAIDMNATLEKSTLQFGTLMGDADAAQAHVRGLFEFAKKTPFETGPIIAASLKLQTFGGAALNTIDNLTLLGDASAAVGAPIEELGFWTGRLYANLKAGQPFGEAAARLQDLAVMTPQARAELESMQRAGKSGEEMFAAFQGRLGAFSGAMVAQANAWGGLTSSISDAVNIMMADTLKPLFDLVKTGAQVVLTALGSQGLEKAFASVRDTLGDTLGPNGGVGVVKGFVSTLLTGVDLALAAVGYFGQGLGGLKAIVFGVGLVVAQMVENTLTSLGYLVSAAEKIPGIGDKFKGIGEGVRAATDYANSLKVGLADLTRESAAAALGQDTWGRSVGGARTVVQALRSEIEAATIATATNATKTTAAAAAREDATLKTKAQEAAEKAAAKQTEHLYKEIDKLHDKTTSLYDAMNSDAFGTWERTVTDSVNLTSRSTQETARLRDELAAWATLNGATLAPSIRQVTSATTDADTAVAGFRASLSTAMKDLPGVMLSALQGGGDVGKSVGAHLGQSIGTWAGEKAAPFLASKFGATIAGGIGTLFGPIGTAIGGFLGDKIGAAAGSLFGKVFKSEGKQVNNLRDDFEAAAGGIHELNVKAQAAGLTLDRLLRAKTVKDYQAAVAELTGAFDDVAATTSGAREAMDAWGISAVDAGHKFAQADMDETANDMLKKLKDATKAGVDLGAIVNYAGDDFGKMVSQAIRTGTTISNEFRPVIAAMIENKTLVDENGVAYESLADVPFAEDITGGLKDVTVGLKELVEFFKSGVFGAFAKATDVGVAFGDRVTRSIQAIPRDIRIEVNGEYHPPEIPGADPGYRVGTYGRHGEDFVDFPTTGKRVIVHAREAIVPESGAAGFVARYLERHGATTAVAGPAGGPVSLSQTILVEINDGGATARVVSDDEAYRRRHNRLSRSGRLMMPLRSVLAGA